MPEVCDVFEAHTGTVPLLVSVPHDGRLLPDDLRPRMTAAALDLPDTDWHVAELYEFARALGAWFVVANYSRYVVDLNRPANDETLYPGQLATGLCPVETFGGEPIYTGEGVDAFERQHRVATYWRPYHEHIAATLNEIRDRHGYALLWDAHSIPSRVPRLFDGELPALNLGTFDRQSCGAELEAAVAAAAQQSTYSSVVNGRFKGGYITRHYGDPGRSVHSLQLEIAQRAYMDETSGRFDAAKADGLRATLVEMFEALLTAAAGLS